MIFLIAILIFSNQYLLVNEEFFILIAFCILLLSVKNSLGKIVENELLDRKQKILNSYLEYLNKKTYFMKVNKKILEVKAQYLYNYVFVQNDYFELLLELLETEKKNSVFIEKKNQESLFLFYFVSFVAKKQRLASK